MDKKSVESSAPGGSSREQAHEGLGDITSEVLSRLKNLGMDQLGLLELSRESLKEVIRLTEYEDGKANRILTTFGFLSALAGAVSVALLPKAPNGTLTAVWQWDCTHFVFFGLFFCYALLVTVGSSVVLWAIRPRFNIPRSWEGDATTRPRSRFFFAMILKTDPSKWAQYFAETPSDDIKLDYVRDYIHETYLVADKIRVKLRFLQPGLFILWVASAVLVLWVMSAPFALVGGASPGTARENQVSGTIDNAASASSADAGQESTLRGERPDVVSTVPATIVEKRPQ